MPGSPLQDAIRRLAFGESLTAPAITSAFDIIMRGEATPAQVGALLMALRVKGETPEEVAGVARALRSAMVRLETTSPEELVDTCGTGGGAVPTFNISTAAALLAAGAGVRIAKHGNRSFTSKCGSADVLEALGIGLDAPPEQMRRTLEQAGIVFMFAPAMHPAMKHVGPIRRELAIPTVMNIVGPLANPAGAGRQLVGVAELPRLQLLANALAVLGTRHAMVVFGEPGMDEVSPLGVTRVLEVRDGAVREWSIDPARFGFRGITAGELAGSEPRENAQIVTEVLSGGGTPGGRASVMLNAGAAIYLAGITTSYDEGVEAARGALEAGKGAAALERLRVASAA